MVVLLTGVLSIIMIIPTLPTYVHPYIQASRINKPEIDMNMKIIIDIQMFPKTYSF